LNINGKIYLLWFWNFERNSYWKIFLSEYYKYINRIRIFSTFFDNKIMKLLYYEFNKYITDKLKEKYGEKKL